MSVYKIITLAHDCQSQTETKLTTLFDVAKLPAVFLLFICIMKVSNSVCNNLCYPDFANVLP